MPDDRHLQITRLERASAAKRILHSVTHLPREDVESASGEPDHFLSHAVAFVAVAEGERGERRVEAHAIVEQMGRQPIEKIVNRRDALDTYENVKSACEERVSNARTRGKALDHRLSPKARGVVNEDH